MAIDGVESGRYLLRSLRSEIGVVLQEAILFRRAVREAGCNGRGGSGGDDSRAQSLLVEALPKGLDTMLNERGGNRSGEHPQRIMLARVPTRDAPLMP